MQQRRAGKGSTGRWMGWVLGGRTARAAGWDAPQLAAAGCGEGGTLGSLGAEGVRGEGHWRAVGPSASAPGHGGVGRRRRWRWTGGGEGCLDAVVYRWCDFWWWSMNMYYR